MRVSIVFLQKDTFEKSCHKTKDASNVMKMIITNVWPKMQLLPFCFVGQNMCSAKLHICAFNTFANEIKMLTVMRTHVGLS